jgi:hypothetical protein
MHEIQGAADALEGLTNLTAAGVQFKVPTVAAPFVDERNQVLLFVIFRVN